MGFYGQFPINFNVYFAGNGKDKKTHVFILANSVNGQVVPLNVFTIHKRLSKHGLTLHAGNTINSAPLGLAGI